LGRGILGACSRGTRYAPQIAHPRKEAILWSSLPDWAQFAIAPSSYGEAFFIRHEDGTERWNAMISASVHAPLESLLASSLDGLDALGFDCSGYVNPDRSYYVSIFQWGHSREIHLRADGGASASVTVLNTLGNLSLFVRYSPS
jgi:hypothetical protein